MTAVLDPIEFESLGEPSTQQRRARSSVGQWRFAARLARREVRRRPGRTLLVLLLVAVPVIGMTIGSILARTESTSSVESFRRNYGRADATAWYSSDPSRLAHERAVERLLAALPAGSRIVGYGEAYGSVAVAGRRDFVSFTDLPLSDPITAGIVQVQQGRAPRTAGEILISKETAKRLGLQLGSDAEFTSPPARFTVVGIGRLTRDFGQHVVVAPGFDTSTLEANRVWNRRGLIDLPAGATLDTIGPEGLVGFTIDTPGGPFSSDSELRVDQLAWGWVAGALALAVFGIVVTAAFATGARRQLVTLGQLSANGAPQRVLRRMQWLQGAWSGLIGSAFGVAAGSGLLFVGRPLIESFVRRDVPSFRFSVFDLTVIVLTGTVAATIAAGLPARSISRVPTLSALAGRRPLAPVPRRLVPMGALYFVAGVLLLAGATVEGRHGSSGNLTAAVAVLGGVLVLAGACCLSPVLIKVLGGGASRAGGAARLAARSLVRTRTRSAAVVAAVCATAAFALAGAMAVRSDEVARGPFNTEAYLPGDVLVISPSVQEPQPEDFRSVQDATTTALGDVTWTDLRGVYGIGDTPMAVLADPPVLAAVGLKPDSLATLEREGIISLELSGIGQLLITPEYAERTGQPVHLVGRLGRLPQALTNEQADRLDELFAQTFDPFAPGFQASQGTPQPAYLNYIRPDASLGTGWVMPVVAGAALLVTLLVVAIGLALSAAESRDERDVLLAVGARPRTMRRLAAHKAFMLAGAGCVLAVPVGLVPAAVVLRSADHLVAVPWVALGLVVLVIPVAAAGASWFGSTLAHIVKPTRFSTLAAD